MVKRLFCAIDLPERVTDEITTTYQAIEGARWVDEEKLHITLRFYGETDSSRKTALISHLAAIPLSPFYLRLKGVGKFPPRNEAKVLWVGIVATEELLTLQGRIESAAVLAGFSPEPRKFSPHITVARLHTGSAERVARFCVTNSLFTTAPFEVRAFHLYSSQLTGGGAVYEKEVSFETDRSLRR